MEGARPHSFRITLFSSLFLSLGFFIGFYSIYLSMFHGKINNKAANDYSVAGSTIMSKRMQAIKSARHKGLDSYEFEVSGFYPTLNK